MNKASGLERLLPAARCRWAGLLLLLLPALAPAGVEIEIEQRWVLSARVWGLAKYRHPEVVQCRHAWDQILIDRLPAIEQGRTADELESELVLLLDAAGEGGRQAPDADTPDWIATGPFSDDFKARLAWLVAQRPERQCYVALGVAGEPVFPDQEVNPSLTSRETRLLGAFRFWNAIEYFFPYKDDIGRPWEDVLAEHVVAIAEAGQRADYDRAMRRFTAEIRDSHGFFIAPTLQIGVPPPFSVRTVDGKPIVARTVPPAAEVSPGDELLAVGGVGVATLRQRLAPIAYGSNPVTAERNLLSDLISAQAALAVYRLRRANGTSYDIALPLQHAYRSALEASDGPVWRRQQLAGGCQAGIVDMARLQSAQVAQLLADLRQTDLLVFDLRNYPSDNAMWTLVESLYPQPRSMAVLTFPDLREPGRFVPWNNVLGGTQPNLYRGRIVLLFDEVTQSAAEFSVMGLQAVGDTIAIGSQTAAADGNLTWIFLPGNIRAAFTGLGVYYPDGRPTQRIGIVPDLHVVPSLAGIRAGRDEAMERALDCRWTQQRPPPRVARTGMYWQPSRGGEGIDILRVAQNFVAAVYSYDDSGDPEWLLGAAPMPEGRWNGSLERYYRDGSRETVGVGPQFDFHRGPYHPRCAIADQANLHPRASMHWPPEAPVGPLCLTPLLLSGESPRTGTWGGPPEETGWGVNIHHARGVLSAILFVYDSAGHPRWLFGQTPWNGQGEATVAMQRIRGPCRQCPPRELEIDPAGSLTLHLPNPSTSIDAGNWLSTDVLVDPQSPWLRERMPLRRMTDVESL